MSSRAAWLKKKQNKNVLSDMHKQREQFPLPDAVCFISIIPHKIKGQRQLVLLPRQVTKDQVAVMKLGSKFHILESQSYLATYCLTNLSRQAVDSAPCSRCLSVPLRVHVDISEIRDIRIFVRAHPALACPGSFYMHDIHVLVMCRFPWKQCHLTVQFSARIQHSKSSQGKES